MNDDLQSFIEPELEARIVALVLGESSAFETGELEKLIAEQPELQAFKERLEAVHGVVGEAHREVDSEEWQLSAEKREAILSRYRKAAQAEVVEKRRERGARRSQRNLIFACAACLLLTLILGGAFMPMGKKAELLSYSAGSKGLVSEKVAPEDTLAMIEGDIIRESARVEEHRQKLDEIVQGYGVPYFDSDSSNSLGATEQDMFRSTRLRLADLQTSKNVLESKLRDGLNEGMAIEDQAALSSELDTTNKLIGRVSGVVDNWQNDTVDLSLRQHNYAQAKESYEQSRAMLREMKIIRGNVGAELGEKMPSTPPVDQVSVSEALSSLDTALGIDEKSSSSFREKAQTEVTRKPASPSASLSKVIAANSASPTSIPVPEVETELMEGDVGNGSDFGGGWGNGKDGKRMTGGFSDDSVRSDYYSAALDQTGSRMLMEVDRSWELAVFPTTRGQMAKDGGDDSDPFSVNNGEEDPFSTNGKMDSMVSKKEMIDPGEIDSIPLYFSSGNELRLERESATAKKLNETILPEFNLENKTVEEAVALIEQKMIQSGSGLDPLENGVEFKIREPAVVTEIDNSDGFGAPTNHSETRIKKLNLKNVPARVALEYIADAAKVRYRIEDDGKVTLLPLGEGADADLVQRRWEVSPEFREFLKNVTGSRSDRDSIEAMLRQNGVSFPESTSVNYLPKNNTLIVRNTPINLELIDGIVKAHKQVLKEKDVAEKARLEKLKKRQDTFETSTSKKSDSTFSLNVSDVSFKLAKAALAEGNWPDASQVRPEEFVNALNYGDRKPSQMEKVACAIEQGAHPFMPQRNLMRIAMSTASLGRNASTPLRLTILLDQSGSMERADRAESVQRAFALLAAQLNANDEVTLIGFARTPRLLAERVKGNEAAKLAGIIANPLTEGGTNLEAALSSGLQMARQQFLAGAQNRIILLTDGAANLGDALPENLAKQVEAMRKLEIAFDACGVGADGLNDEVLSSLAKQGDGRYYFLDRPEDADEGFAKQIAGALRPAAKNVKVQILFNPERVSKFKLYGFEKHKLKKEDFRNDSVDAAEMAAEESGVALYHFEALPEGRGEIGTVSVRFLDTASQQMVERTWAIPYEPEAAFFSEAEPNLRLASVAGLFAEKLKGSEVGERVDLKRLRQETGLLKSIFDQQVRFRELQTMLQQAGE